MVLGHIFCFSYLVMSQLNFFVVYDSYFGDILKFENINISHKLIKRPGVLLFYPDITFWSYLVMFFLKFLMMSRISRKLEFDTSRPHLVLQGQLNLVSFKSIFIISKSIPSFIIYYHIGYSHLELFHSVLWVFRMFFSRRTSKVSFLSCKTPSLIHPSNIYVPLFTLPFSISGKIMIIRYFH